MGASASAARDYGVDDEYEWVRPPVDGWTADDLDHLPNLPLHTELIHGSLVFRSPQTRFHARAIPFFEHVLLSQAPEHLEPMAGMTVTLDKRNRLEPDVLVVLGDACTGLRQTWFKPEDVVLTVEVVSEESVERDREVKPRKYARAGIPHFWRVEENDGLPVVYVYELDPATHSYAPTGIHHKQLKTDRPFPIDIDLTAVGRRRPGGS
ncbi:Uma2 family endonuclease [Streptomyces sp. BR1]|uniref:Uma2 family endonuclease n=1 Tax=Streptomyces sp. BR1 TaxID=1592323 RepID=UPI00402B12DF